MRSMITQWHFQPIAAAYLFDELSSGVRDMQCGIRPTLVAYYDVPRMSICRKQSADDPSLDH